MNNQEYQALTKTIAIYPPEKAIEYLGLGLASEAGEVTGAIKKAIRGDYPIEILKVKLKPELGDVLWYVARLCDELGLDLSQVMASNIEKLTIRRVNSTLKGDGDER